MFTPLKTKWGFSVEELRSAAGGRDICIWGAGILGRGLKRRLQMSGFCVRYFLDINPAINNCEGSPVYRPAERLAEIKKDNVFLIVLVVNQSKLVESQCIEAGLEKNKDFILYYQTPRQMAVIETSGFCNYGCSVCAKKTRRSENQYMELSTYKKTLNKLLDECPLVVSVDISLWSEPLTNPDIAGIIQETEKRVPCRVFTKLRHDKYLECMLQSSPSQITVIASGYEASYEENERGLSWRIFLTNLEKLKKYKEKYNASSVVNILFVLYKNNAADFSRMKALGESFGFKTVIDNSYLSPYDNFMDICDGIKLSAELQSMAGNSSLNLKNILETAKKDAANPCIVQRIFPIINYDLSVSVCHLFCKPVIAENFLETPYSKIIEQRGACEYCRKCQGYGLHRLDTELLQKRYPNDELLSCTVVS